LYNNNAYFKDIVWFAVEMLICEKVEMPAPGNRFQKIRLLQPAL